MQVAKIMPQDHVSESPEEILKLAHYLPQMTTVGVPALQLQHTTDKVSTVLPQECLSERVVD